MITSYWLNALHLKIKKTRENIHYEEIKEDHYKKEYIPADHKRVKFAFSKNM